MKHSTYQYHTREKTDVAYNFMGKWDDDWI